MISVTEFHEVLQEIVEMTNELDNGIIEWGELLGIDEEVLAVMASTVAYAMYEKTDLYEHITIDQFRESVGGSLAGASQVGFQIGWVLATRHRLGKG